MKGSFYEMRGTGRHEATDMLAPRNTPIHAVCDGRIAKLFLSRFGGTTIYQFDPQERFVFYYAHLQSYAPGLKDGQLVHKGDVIAFVGTSGNAPPNTPHLHLSISVLGKEKQWWKAAPLDPYEVFAHRPMVSGK
ncbi:MAG TPA: M23 family metallopeptidase [Planktothrix sp.]